MMMTGVWLVAIVPVTVSIFAPTVVETLKYFAWTDGRRRKEMPRTGSNCRGPILTIMLLMSTLLASVAVAREDSSSKTGQMTESSVSVVDTATPDAGLTTDTPLPPSLETPIPPPTDTLSFSPTESLLSKLTDTRFPPPIDMPILELTFTPPPPSTDTPTSTPTPVSPEPITTPAPMSAEPPASGGLSDSIQNRLLIYVIAGFVAVVAAVVIAIGLIINPGRQQQSPFPPPAPSGPPSTSASVPYLECPGRSAEPRQFPLNNLSGTGEIIGRAMESEGITLRIDETIPGWETVSRHHARICHDLTSGRTVIEDTGSQNGVYVQGRRTARNLLKDGWTVAIGGVEFVYHEPQAGRSQPPQSGWQEPRKEQ